MSQKKYDFVFVVLTYRNDEDLLSFFSSLSECEGTYKVVVVNAFFDEASNAKIREIAQMHQGDFIEIENRGYSYGNNIGIAHAKETYEFDFLIVSNPDIILKRLKAADLRDYPEAVTAAKIQCASGKLQNPMFYKKVTFALWLLYKGSKNHQRIVFYAGVAINKAVRMLGLLHSRMKAGNKVIKIYQAHGAFVIFPKKVLEQLGKVYDENLFLFAEESYLSKKLEEKHILTFYNPNIQVFHKEDGSMKFSRNINEQAAKSNIYVYEKYYGFR